MKSSQRVPLGLALTFAIAVYTLAALILIEIVDAEESINKAELTHNLIMKASQDAIWDWNLLNNQVFWNEGVQNHFGYSSHEVGVNANWWRERIHPDDLERTWTEIQAVIKGGGNYWDDFVVETGHMLK